MTKNQKYTRIYESNEEIRDMKQHTDQRNASMLGKDQYVLDCLQTLRDETARIKTKQHEG